jgi:thymidylate kinase
VIVPIEPRAAPAIATAFDALDRAGIPYRIRKNSWPPEPLAAGSEVDIFLGRSELAATQRVLRAVGFYHLKSAGHRGHRFYVAFNGRRWLKIDAKLIRRVTLPSLPSHWLGAGARRVIRALALRRPLAVRRIGPMIAVLGPDGAGKGTIIESLKEQVPVGLAFLYLGWRPRSTRHRPGTERERGVTPLKEAAYVCYWALRYWWMLLPGYVAAWSGHIVLCDRHPIENLAIQPRATRLAAAVERFLYRHAMPWPDAILLLDAPAGTIYARKREQPPQLLELWRRRYRDVFAPRGATVISTEQSIEFSAAQASAAVWRVLSARRRW